MHDVCSRPCTLNMLLFNYKLSLRIIITLERFRKFSKSVVEFSYLVYLKMKKNIL